MYISSKCNRFPAERCEIFDSVEKVPLLSSSHLLLVMPLYEFNATDELYKEGPFSYFIFFKIPFEIGKKTLKSTISRIGLVLGIFGAKESNIKFQ